MNKLAIIPARSGSKGVKDKNIRNLCGKPLMAYAIDAALKSNIFDCVHVSTDSEVYANVARKYGADVSFLREEEYATDSASTWDTVRYVLKKYSELGVVYDMVTVLQPTSPLRTADDICEAYKVFCDKMALSVVSVCETEYSPLLCNVLGDELSLNNFIDIMQVTNRQDMPIYYRLNGAIYMLKVQVLDNISELYGVNSYAYIMSRHKSVDIDTEVDFIIAEALMGRQV